MALLRRGLREVVINRYPKSEAVLKAANLRTIREYITVRRSTIARKIAERPVLQECREARRQRGTAPRLYWWDQELDFSLDNEHHGDADIEETQDFPLDNEHLGGVDIEEG